MKHLFLIIALLLTVQGVMAQQDTAAMMVQAKKYIAELEYIQATELLDKILLVDDKRADVYRQKALCAFERSRLEDMERAAGMCIALEPDNWDNYFQRGFYYMQYRMFDKAIIDLSKSFSMFQPVRKDTEEDSASYTDHCAFLSWSYFNVRSYDDALLISDKGLVFDSNALSVIYYKIPPLISAKRLDEAFECLERYRKLAGEDLGIVQLYVWYYVNAEKYQEAIDAGNEMLKVEKTPHPALYNNMAFAYYKQGDLKTAMRLVNKSIDKFETNSYAYKNRALIHIANGDMDDACKDLHEASELGYTEQFGDEVDELLLEHCNKM